MPYFSLGDEDLRLTLGEATLAPLAVDLCDETVFDLPDLEEGQGLDLVRPTWGSEIQDFEDLEPAAAFEFQWRAPQGVVPELFDEHTARRSSAPVMADPVPQAAPRTGYSFQKEACRAYRELHFGFDLDTIRGRSSIPEEHPFWGRMAAEVGLAGRVYVKADLFPEFVSDPKWVKQRFASALFVVSPVRGLGERLGKQTVTHVPWGQALAHYAPKEKVASEEGAKTLLQRILTEAPVRAASRVAPRTEYREDVRLSSQSEYRAQVLETKAAQAQARREQAKAEQEQARIAREAALASHVEKLQAMHVRGTKVSAKGVGRTRKADTQDPRAADWSAGVELLKEAHTQQTLRTQDVDYVLNVYRETGRSLVALAKEAVSLRKTAARKEKAHAKALSMIQKGEVQGDALEFMPRAARVNPEADDAYVQALGVRMARQVKAAQGWVESQLLKHHSIRGLRALYAHRFPVEIRQAAAPWIDPLLEGEDEAPEERGPTAEVTFQRVPSSGLMVPVMTVADEDDAPEIQF